jgi:hypothetical protein
MRTARLLLGALGVATIGYALLAAAADPDVTSGRHTLFLLAVLALHDALLMPAFLLIGALVHHAAAGPSRAIIQAALIATAAVTLVALPLVLGYGRAADNPSALPRDYPAGLALVRRHLGRGRRGSADSQARRLPDPTDPAGRAPSPGTGSVSGSKAFTGAPRYPGRHTIAACT